MKINWIKKPTKINKNEVKNKIESNEYFVIQFDENVYTDEILSEINSLASTLNENLEIRFYGHKKGFDCKTLLKVDKLKNLTINCLEKVKNINALSQLNHLSKLNIGIELFKDTEILKFDNLKNLQELTLADTRNINLKHLEEFNNLKKLIISGQFKNIESISEIKTLETLYLGSINKNVSLEFVNKLNQLKVLNINFGSRENINEITNENIEELELFRIRGLNTFESINHFKKLKKFTIKDQAQVSEIIFDENQDLEFIVISNCKKLEKIEGIDKLNNLKIISLLRLPKISFDEFISLKLPKALEHINFYTESKKDKEIKERIKELGYRTS